MADGSILIKTELDNSQAQKELAKLQRQMQKTADALSKSETKHNGIVEQMQQAQAAVDETNAKIQELKADMVFNKAQMDQANAWQRLTPQYAAMQQEYEQQKTLLADYEKQRASQEKVVAGLAKQEQAVTEKIKEQTAALQEQQGRYGAIEHSMANMGSGAMESIRSGVTSLTSSLKGGFKTILKYAFGIRSLYFLARKLRQGLMEGFNAFAQQDPGTKEAVDSLKASLNGLKLSWGAAFAPIVTAVAPLLNKLIGLLTAAANAISMFFAVLSGKGTFKKAVANMDGVAEAASGAGGAAEEAKKQIMGFDELNKLDDNSGGGGGGGGGSGLGDLIEEAIDPNSFASQLAFSVKDVLFDWSDLTPEQIAEKAIAGVAMLGGAIIGGSIGGIPGIIIGAAAGLAFGILLDACTFDHDGELNGEEIAKIIDMGLLAATGGVIGFALGGGSLLGAAIGVECGLAISLLLNKATFNGNGKFDSEEIEKLINIGFNAVAGGVIGFMLGGGPVGAAIGITCSLMFSLLLNKTIFNNDGKLSQQEVYDSIAMAIGTIGGAAIGFLMGGPLGAAIGVTLGLALSFGMISINWEGLREKISNWFTEFTSYFQGYIDKWSSDSWDDVGGNIVFGILDGIAHAALALLGGIWEYLFCKPLDYISELLGISSPSTVYAEIGTFIVEGMLQGLSDTWTKLTTWMGQKLEGLKTTVTTKFDGIRTSISSKMESAKSAVQTAVERIKGFFDFQWKIPYISLPHIQVTWESTGDGAIARLLGISAIPHFSIAWYAKGGIVDGATLFGAGEAGKEAIVPLERNTEWITLVADGLMERIERSNFINRLADAIASVPMPAVAMGTVVPPRAYQESNSRNDDLSEILRALTAASGSSNESNLPPIKIYLDGREMRNSVAKWERRAERSGNY